MTLSALIQKDGLRRLATATVAISATDGEETGATVALANPESVQTDIGGEGVTRSELEAAANRFCDAVGDDANRRAIMLEDCREYPPERLPWLIEYLNAEAAKHEQALSKNDAANDMRRCTECANFTIGGRCLAAWQGKLAGFVSRRYSPAQPDRLRRCDGYTPGPDDPDQRPGQDRWPGLLPDLEVTNDET
jgi:hypothetical protein